MSVEYDKAGPLGSERRYIRTVAVGTRTRLQLGTARQLAGALLGEVGTRWQHSIGVASRAAELSAAVAPADRTLLIAAAWLHDIGYCPRLAVTGFHPLDGARFLAAEGWPLRLCALVAHHSGAGFVAEATGLVDEMAEFPDERSAVTDALALADQTTSPTGVPAILADRIAETVRRHGPDSVQAAVHARRGPYLLGVADRVAHRLAHAGLTQPVV